MPDALQHVRSVGPFDGWLRGAIVQLKYHGEWARAAHLSPLLAATMADMEPFDALVPIPLHASRLRQRGFNQSRLLAEQAARSLGVPVADAVLRTRRTDAQVHLSAVDRHRNVAGAFAVNAEVLVAGKTFILIDDVITTGATLAACADLLRKAGAVSVGAVTLAREM